MSIVDRCIDGRIFPCLSSGDLSRMQSSQVPTLSRQSFFGLALHFFTECADLERAHRAPFAVLWVQRM